MIYLPSPRISLPPNPRFSPTILFFLRGKHFWALLHPLREKRGPPASPLLERLSAAKRQYSLHKRRKEHATRREGRNNASSKERHWHFPQLGGSGLGATLSAFFSANTAAIRREETAGIERGEICGPPLLRSETKSPPRESGGGRCAEENEKLCIRVGVRGGIERNRKEGVETVEGGRVKRNGEGGALFSQPRSREREREMLGLELGRVRETQRQASAEGGRGRGKQSRQGNPRRGRALKKGGNKREGRLQAGRAADVVESFLFPFCIPLLSFVPSSPPCCLAFEFRRNEWNRKRLGLEGERLVFQL